MMKKIVTKCCVQLVIAIFLINVTSFVTFGSIVEASEAYVQSSDEMVLSSNALVHAVSNSNEADFERGFGVRILVIVISLPGVIYMFKAFPFLLQSEKPFRYRVREGVVKQPLILIYVLRWGAITYLFISLMSIPFRNALGLTIWMLIMFLIHLFFHYITERWQVEVKDGTIIKTPLIGRKRIVPWEEMKEIKVGIFLGGIEYSLIKSDGKRLAHLCSWHWRVEDFMTELEKYDIPWSNKMIM